MSNEWFDPDIRSYDTKNVPLAMIERMASGLEDPRQIALEFGFTLAQFKTLTEYEPFQRAIERKRSELDAAGFTFKHKMKAYAEVLADELYQTAISSDSTRSKLDALEYFTRAADLMPKNRESGGDAGPKFVVNISIPQVDVQTVNPEDVVEYDERNTDFELLPAQKSGGVPD